MVTVDTGTCLWCNKPSSLKMTEEQYARYEARKMHGGHIQDVLPEMSPDQREMLISGSHPECFDRMFAEDEEDEG